MGWGEGTGSQRSWGAGTHLSVAQRVRCASGIDARAITPFPVAQVCRTVAHGATGLQERDELALGLGIALDVALRHGQAGMAGELLHVPETPPDLGDAARRTRNEGAASRVRRTPVHLERGIEAMEPQAHRRR